MNGRAQMMHNTKKLELFTTDVHSCARCGADHENVEFVPFAHHPIEDSDGTKWQYWAMCPFHNEPILLRKSESFNK